MYEIILLFISSFVGIYPRQAEYWQTLRDSVQLWPESYLRLHMFLYGNYHIMEMHIYQVFKTNMYLQGKRGRPPKNAPKEDASEESAEDAE